MLNLCCEETDHFIHKTLLLFLHSSKYNLKKTHKIISWVYTFVYVNQ